jgi:hypothetical protein
VRALRTHPFDVVLGLRLLRPAGTIVQLAEELAVVPSQIHGALTRLAVAGLVRPDGRSANARALGEFVLQGVRYAFPAVRGALTNGVPTAYSAPALAAIVDATDVVVWPRPGTAGGVRGFALLPLYARATRLPETSPETYRLLTLVDALRIGDPRTRNAARELLEIALGWRAASETSA